MTLIRKGNTSWFLSSPGTLQTDRYGLSSATAVWTRMSPTDTDPGRPSGTSFGDSHPIWTTLKCDRSTISQTNFGWQATAEYFGIQGAPPTPIYELDWSTSEEPIETHPDFVATLAGTPAARLNDADFDDKGFFIGFKPSSSLAGVRGYLAPGAVWRETSITTTVPGALGSVGAIVSPSGPVPSVPSPRTWLYLGLTYQQRGQTYTVKKEWRLSGRKGWNTLIYTTV